MAILNTEEIEKELCDSLNDPHVYLEKLKAKIFNLKDQHFNKIVLFEDLCIKKIPTITKDMDEHKYENISLEIAFIWKEIYKDIERDTNLSDDRKKALIYLKWLPYITRYNINLKEIKGMLLTCEKLINDNRKKWYEFFTKKTSDIKTLLEGLKPCESQEKIIVCTFLRRIIETIFELQILNNKDSIKNKFKPLGIYSYYKFLSDENIDWKIRTLEEKEGYCQCINGINHYKYAIYNIWENKRYLTKKIYNKLLSYNIHQQFENFISFDDFNRSKDSKILEKYKNKKIKELDQLRDFLSELFLTLERHLVSFEKGELTVVVRDFKIDEGLLVEKYFKNDTNYKFEKINGINFETKCKELGIIKTKN